MMGDKVKIGDLIGKEMQITGYTVSKSKYDDKDLLTLQIKLNDEDRIVFTGSKVLINQCEKYKDNLPFIATIQKINDRFYSFT